MDKLNHAVTRDIEEWVKSEYLGCRPDADGNLACDNGALCGRCMSRNAIDLMDAEKRRIMEELRPIEPGDEIIAFEALGGILYDVAHVVYDEAWTERPGGPGSRVLVYRDCTFVDSDGDSHCWKSWIDGGHVNRARRGPDLWAGDQFVIAGRRYKISDRLSFIWELTKVLQVRADRPEAYYVDSFDIKFLDDISGETVTLTGVPVSIIDKSQRKEVTSC